MAFSPSGFLRADGLRAWPKLLETERAFLLAGSDAGLIEETERDLGRRFLGEGDSVMGRTILDAAQRSAADILDELAGMSLFSERRVFVVRSAEKILGKDKEAYKDLPKLLDSLDPETLVVFTTTDREKAREKDIAASPLAARLVKRRAAAYLYAPRDDAEAAGWAKAWCARHDVAIAPAAATLVVSLVGRETRELAQELRKMADAIPKTPAPRLIDEKAVAFFLEPHRESVPFEWATAILAGRRPAVAGTAVASDHGREAVAVLGALVWMLNEVEKFQSGEFINPWTKKDVEPLARRWPLARLGRAREVLLELDLQLKSSPADSHLARLELAASHLVDLGAQHR